MGQGPVKTDIYTLLGDVENFLTIIKAQLEFVDDQNEAMMLAHRCFLAMDELSEL